MPPGAIGGLVGVILAVLCGPETKGKVFAPKFIVT